MVLSAWHRGWVGPPKGCNDARHALLLRSDLDASPAIQHGFLPRQQRTVDGHRHKFRAVTASSAPRWNPQNVDDPVKMPSVTFSAHDAVAVQLESLRQNDDPWPNHGMQTMYVFGEGIGGLDPAWYFGYQKDLYHQDHFFGMFASAFPQLINADTWEITATKQVDDNRTMVEAAVTPRGSSEGGSSCSVTFALRRKTVGSNKGAWLTKMLLHGNMAQATAHIDGLMAR